MSFVAVPCLFLILGNSLMQNTSTLNGNGCKYSSRALFGRVRLGLYWAVNG